MQSTNKQAVLVIDDDAKLADYICHYLEQHGFRTRKAHDGHSGIEEIIGWQPEVVLLDLMLPGTDGLDVCRQVRSRYEGHILMLTGIEDDLDQVAAIEVGVDDYVVKPVQLRVLLARIRMLLRRGNGSPSSEIQASSAETSGNNANSDTELQYGELEIFKKVRDAYLSGQLLDLTSSEFDLLWLLALHPEEILSREMLLQSLRGIKYDGVDRSIDARVVGLRKKVEDNPSKPFRILTVRGKGYMFAPDAWSAN